MTRPEPPTHQFPAVPVPPGPPPHPPVAGWTYPGIGPGYQPHPTRQVTKSRKETRHGLHLFLTICTFGAWGFVWPCVWAWNRFGPRARTVTRYR